MKKISTTNVFPAIPNSVAYIITSDENLNTQSVEVVPVLAWEIRDGFAGKYAHPITPADINPETQDVYPFDADSGVVFSREHGVFDGIEELVDCIYTGVPWNSDTSKTLSAKFGHVCDETH